MNYYYTIDGTQVEGPNSLEAILAGYKNGSLPKNTQICEEGNQEWTSIESIANLPPQPAAQLAGSYAGATLQENETPVYRASIHKAIYARNIIAMGLCPAVFFFYAFFSPMHEDASGFATFILIMLTAGVILGVITAIIRRSNTELLITNRRVLVKVGFLSRHTAELFISQVESVAVSQGPFGRLWNYGTVAIRGTGGMCKPIKMIAAPLEFRNRLQQMLSK